MNIGDILLSRRFVKQHAALSSKLKRRLEKTVRLFRENPLHPSLRLHKLTGPLNQHWSISINLQYRVIFEMLENGDILFVSVGTHAIYDD